MLIWFGVVAAIIVAEVFRSPMVDYRLVAFGAIFPLVDNIVGNPTVLHTLVGPVGVLTAVMLGTIGRRLLRRRLLGIPIGMFLHLVLDFSWDDPSVFWWPAFGTGLTENVVIDHQFITVRVVLELIGIGAGYWAYRRYGLADKANRDRLLRQGHLNRDVLP